MEVNIIKDSISNQGIRLTTMHLRYWRPIHSELMTHRVFSRNARSSRAVPVATLLSEQIFVPQFGMNQRGMQASDVPVDPELLAEWTQDWKDLAQINRDMVEKWGRQGMHKQWANRPLEWFGWIDVLVSSTDWENFWALRDHSAAQPELQMLAVLMRERLSASAPKFLHSGEWHLPYILDEEYGKFAFTELLKLSTARCARLSYRPFDGNPDLDREVERFENLVVSQPVHASPAEHQATPDERKKFPYRGDDYHWVRPDLHGNFHGWMQHRKMIPNESVPEKRV